MMTIGKQINEGKLICPKSKQKLVLSSDGEYLISDDISQKYRLIDKRVPIILLNPDWVNKYVAEAKNMLGEYTPESLSKNEKFFDRIKARLTQDYRTESCKKAFLSIFQSLPGNSLCLSIGGGPRRDHPQLVNVNVAPFPNVDIVADANSLPYDDECVDAIHCEAVLEHLQYPQKAVREMWRVLKPGGKVFACTPFMQAYHGYPRHYQNFTITGQKSIFETEGFNIIESGTAVGPMYTVVSVIGVFFKEYSPKMIRDPLRIIWGLFGALLKYIVGQRINKKENSHVLASMTYVVAIK